MKNAVLMLLLTLSVFSLYSENAPKFDSLETQISEASGSEKVELLINLSEAYRNVMFDNCIINGQKAVILAQKLNNLDLEGKALKSMGVSCYVTSDYKTALDFFLKAYDVFKKSNNILQQGNCLSNVGLIYDEWSDYRKAEEYYKRALKLKTKADDKASMATTLINLGNISYYKFNYQKSLDYYYRARLLFTEAGDNEGVGQCLNNIAIIYKAWGNINQAVEYLKEAENFYVETGNDFELSKVYTNLADTYCENYKDYKRGLEYYEKSLELKEGLDDSQGIAMVYNNLGSLYGNLEDYKKAVEYFALSRALYEKLNSPSGLVMVNQNEGKIAMLQKHYDIAKEYFLKSLKTAHEINLADYISSNEEYLLKLYASTGNYDKFNKYYSLFITGKDTLLSQLNKAKMDEIEARYLAEEQLHETMNLRSMNEKSDKTIKQYKLLFAGLAGLILLVVVILLLYWWYRRPK